MAEVGVHAEAWPLASAHEAITSGGKATDCDGVRRLWPLVIGLRDRGGCRQRWAYTSKRDLLYWHKMPSQALARSLSVMVYDVHGRLPLDWEKEGTSAEVGVHDQAWPLVSAQQAIVRTGKVFDRDGVCCLLRLTIRSGYGHRCQREMGVHTQSWPFTLVWPLDREEEGSVGGGGCTPLSSAQ